MKKHNHSKKKLHHFPTPPSVPSSKTLAVCMIVKDEEQRLPQILSDIQGLWDELIIVDTGSSDRTVEIARQFGARVFSQPWTGDFSAARNRSKDEATATWILWLDADDRMDAAHVKRLQSLKPTLNKACVYALPVISTMADGSAEPFLQVRLFPNDVRLRFENRVHEDIARSVKKYGFKGATLPVQITHTGYEDPAQLSLKIQRNMLLLEEDLARNPDNIVLRFLYANNLAYFRRFHEAAVHYEQIVRMPGARQEQEDVYHGALVRLAQIYNLHNRRREAADLARQATVIRPEDMQGWYQWGSVLMRMNESQAALEKFFRALACPQPLSSIVVNYRALKIFCLEGTANTLVTLGRKPEAERLLRDAFKQEPWPEISALLDKHRNEPCVSEEELLQQGQELLDSKAYAEASKIFIRVIKSNPECFAAYNALGQIAWYSGQYDDAYVLFKKAAQTGSEHEDILLNLWDAAQATGKIEDGRTVLAEILSRNPGMKKIEDLLEKNA
jgi:glycosyltransferase involved in cell wall biosynthesis